MRVAIVAFKSLPIYAIQLANGLATLAEVHLFIDQSAGGKYSDFINSEVRVHMFKNVRYRNPAGLLVSGGLIRRIKRNRCDLAHLIISEPWFNLYIPWISSLPVVTTVHDVKYHIGDRRSSIVPQMITDFATKFSFALIAHGYGIKKHVCEEFKVDPSRVFVIPMMSFSIYRHWEMEGVKEEKNNILFFGSIWEYKGLKYLMQAEEYLSEKLQEYRITIAGRGEDFRKYEKYIRKPRNYEIINEFIRDEKVAELFQKAAVVVLPYVDASQSGVASLAFSFGKPVVATNVGSIPELVENGRDGIIVPAKDPQAICKAIITLLSDSALRKRMSENVRLKADNELSWSRVGHMHLNAYEEIMAMFESSGSAFWK